VLIPVVVVAVVVIVVLIAGAVFVYYRARNLQTQIQAVRMSGFDETDADMLEGAEDGMQLDDDSDEQNEQNV